jgi:hypothetical protein
MASFVNHQIMGTTLETTDRYTNLQAQGIGASGVIWYLPTPATVLPNLCRSTNDVY